jgi:hypothetical protein
MDALQAYSLIAAELEAWRSRSYDELVACVGAKPEPVVTEVGADFVTTEVRFSWADKKLGSIRIETTVYGPSSWRLERWSETAIVKPPGIHLRSS